MDQIRHTSGISSIVNFGRKIPIVPEAVIADLKRCFGEDEALEVETCPKPGDGVTLTAKAFFGMEAVVLRSWPAKRRVQVLLEFLGRPTQLEVDCTQLTVERRPVAGFVPALVAVPNPPRAA